MAKLSPQQNSGHRGEALVQKIVVDAGMIWNPIARDFGFDGQIDFVDVEGNVSGTHVLVQVKATTQAVQDANSVMTLLCQADWVDLWMRTGRPVVLVLVDLKAQRAFYKRVDSWFRDPERRQRRVVSFDTGIEVFDEHVVCNLSADALPIGEELPRFGEGESLVSNMLTVEAFAPFLYSAPTPCQRRSDAWERMDANRAYESGFHITGGQVWSLRSIEDSPLSVLCGGPITSSPTADWANSDDPDVQRRFVALLNYTLRAMHHPYLVWHPRKCVVYYQAPRHLKRIKVKGKSVRSRGVSFFTPYIGTDATNKVKFCRHNAADLRFRRWGDTWVLEINPTYHYTIDGKRDSLYDSEYLSKIKRMERNNAVRNSVRAWADLLRHRTGDTLFGPADDRILFDDLFRVDVDVSIIEALWIPPPEPDRSDSVLDGLWEDQ